MQLRHYQLKAIDLVRKSIANGHKRICVVIETGGGKTRTFSHMCNTHIKKGGRVLVLTHRIELLKQAGGVLEGVEEIKANSEPDLSKPIHCAMIATLLGRLKKKDYYKKFLSKKTLLVIDEAHRADYDPLFDYLEPEQIVLGFTATPLREGKQRPLSDFYTDMVEVIDTNALIQEGFLSKAMTYGVDIDLKGVNRRGGDFDPNSVANMFSEKKVYEGVIDNYKKICPNTKAILYASNVKSSIEICEQLNLAGIPAKHLDSDKKRTTDRDREEIFKWFKETPNGVLCNYEIATTGYDEPTIKTVILYYASESLIKFKQTAGRGGRVIPGVKDSFYLLDFGGNIQRHSFWESPRTWSLTKKQRKKKEGPAPVKICPGCRAMLAVSVMQCTYCRYEFKKEYGGKNEFAELRLLSPPEIWKKAEAADIATKARMAKEKLIKPMQVLHKLKTKEEGLEFIRQMGYKPTFAYLNRDRFKCFESL